jgi:hypothetical protein
MDSSSLSRTNQLRSFIALAEKASGGGDSFTIDTFKRNEIVISIEKNHILVEPAGDSSSTACLLVSAFIQALTKLLQKQSVSEIEQFIHPFKLTPATQTVELGLVLFRATISSSSHARFISSYAMWGTVILDAIKKEGAESFHGLGLMTMATLFTRLSSLASNESNSVRRDGSPLASKSCSMALQILSGLKSSSSDLRFALKLIRSVLSSLPISLRQQSGPVEQGLVKLINTQSSSNAALESAAACLALIPRIQGTPEVWSLFARRTLISMSESIDAILMGLGEPALAAKGREALGPDMSNVECLLGPLPSLGAGLKGSLQPAVNNLVVLLTVIEKLLTTSHPLPVPLPGAAILSQLVRLVKMDEGAILQAGRTAPSAGLFTELCISMPSIRAGAWDCITLLIQVSGLSFSSYYTSCARLICDSLRRIRARGLNSLVGSPTKERLSLYNAAAEVARAGGFAVARILADEAFGASLVEIYGSSPTSHDTDGPVKKKAKVEVKVEERFESGSVSAEDLATQCAALGMIESMVLSGGSLIDPGLRANIDTLSLHVASTSFEALQLIASDGSLGQASLQASAHSTLSALINVSLSLLSASIQTPPSTGHQALYLSEAISLFRRGLSQGTSEVKGTCFKSIASIECCLHPRSGALTTGVTGIASNAFSKPRLWSSVNYDTVPALLSADPHAGHHHHQDRVELLIPPHNTGATTDRGKGAVVSYTKKLAADEKRKPVSSPVVMTHKPVVPLQAAASEPRQAPQHRAVMPEESEDSEGPMPDIDEGNE